MLTLQEISDRLADRRIPVVAKATGLHYNTIAKVRNGGGNPSYSVLKALSDYLTDKA